MVRNLVGTFLLLGRGTITAKDLKRILDLKDRSAAGQRLDRKVVPGERGILNVKIKRRNGWRKDAASSQPPRFADKRSS